MNESNSRMTQRDNPPGASEIEQWIGREAYAFWKKVTLLIEQSYPKVFDPEWHFGGQKHGWSLRYKKNKSFCTLIPEKNRFVLLIFLVPKRGQRWKAYEINCLHKPGKNRTTPQHTTMESGFFSPSIMTWLNMMWNSFLQ